MAIQPGRWFQFESGDSEVFSDATKIVGSGDSGVFGLFTPNAGNCQNMTVRVLEGRRKLAKNPTNPTSATPQSGRVYSTEALPTIS
jgi:hypothetical protein